MEKTNFISKFFRELTTQILEIKTPFINNFLKQSVTVLSVTIFFSFFFYCISFFWLKFLTYIYNVGN